MVLAAGAGWVRGTESAGVAGKVDRLDRSVMEPRRQVRPRFLPARSPALPEEQRPARNAARARFGWPVDRREGILWLSSRAGRTGRCCVRGSRSGQPRARRDPDQQDEHRQQPMTTRLRRLRTQHWIASHSVLNLAASGAPFHHLVITTRATDPFAA